MLEDQRRLGVGDVRLRAELRHEVAQALGGRRGHVQQEVVLPGEEEHVQHLGQPGDFAREGPDVGAGGRLQPHRDHGLQRAS